MNRLTTSFSPNSPTTTTASSSYLTSPTDSLLPISPATVLMLSTVSSGHTHGQPVKHSAIMHILRAVESTRDCSERQYGNIIPVPEIYPQKQCRPSAVSLVAVSSSLWLVFNARPRRHRLQHQRMPPLRSVVVGLVCIVRQCPIPFDFDNKLHVSGYFPATTTMLAIGSPSDLVHKHASCVCASWLDALLRP